MRKTCLASYLDGNQFNTGSTTDFFFKTTTLLLYQGVTGQTLPKKIEKR